MTLLALLDDGEMTPRATQNISEPVDVSHHMQTIRVHAVNFFGALKLAPRWNHNTKGQGSGSDPVRARQTEVTEDRGT